MNILILGRQDVGKTTLINNLTNNEGIKTILKNIHFCNNKNESLLNIDKIIYNYNNLSYIYYDIPNIFNNIKTNEKECLEYIEIVVKTIKNIDCIFFCIESNVFGINDLDIKSLKLLSNFPFLDNKIRIIFTKMNKIPKELRSKINSYALNIEYPYLYSYKYKYDSTFKFNLLEDKDNINLLNWIDLIYSKIIYQINNINHSILFDKYVSIPIVEHVQKLMKENNYFPINYSKYLDKHKFYKKIFYSYIFMSSLSILLTIFPTITIFDFIYENNINTFVKYGLASIISFIFIIIHFFFSFFIYNQAIIENITTNFKNYRWDNEKLKLISSHKAPDFLLTKKTKIYYSNGKIFFSGTMCGNIFDKGLFYYQNGHIMYVKK